MRGRAKMSSTEASSTARPAYITTTRSAISATTPRSCVMKRIAMPNSACSRRIRSRICAWMVTSRAVGRLVGDEQPGTAGKGHRDHDALAHTA